MFDTIEQKTTSSSVLQIKEGVPSTVEAIIEFKPYFEEEFGKIVKGHKYHPSAMFFKIDPTNKYLWNREGLYYVLMDENGVMRTISTDMFKILVDEVNGEKKDV